MSSGAKPTREKILAASLELLESGQGNSVRMSDIAAKVGITKGGPKIAADEGPEGGETENQEADPTRDGQAAYESKGTEPGLQLDREL